MDAGVEVVIVEIIAQKLTDDKWKLKRSNDFSEVMKQKFEPEKLQMYQYSVVTRHAFRPAIVVPYSLYKSRHILGTWLSSICNLWSI